VSDTLHGVPVPDEIQLRQAIESALRPLVRNWDARSQDMLDVLADSSLARAEVRRGVAWIRVAAVLGVVAMAVSGLAIWTALERDRLDRRLYRQLDEQARQDAVAELGWRMRSLCLPRDEWPLPAPERSKGRLAPGKP
jgi:hypothetical protein